jgi:endonuclease/exonuclease/phosphatase family metal-dependent hydrolase
MKTLFAAVVCASLVFHVGCAGSPRYAVDRRVLPAAAVPPGEPGDAAGVRVMSFNVRTRTMLDALNHWNHRKSLLVETIREFDPDLLGTQECTASQAAYLREKLVGYQFVGVGRNDGHESGEMCAIFFKSSKFEKLAEGHFWLSTTPEVPGSKSWGSWWPRMVTWVKLRPRDPATGGDLVFFNTHFDSQASAARRESAVLLQQRMARIAGGLPTVLTGDFNTDEGSKPYDTLLAGLFGVGEKLLDTFRQAHPDRLAGEGTRHRFHGTTSGPRIDWIMTTRAFQTVSASIDRTHRGGRYPSDHFPVTAVLQRVTPVAFADEMDRPGAVVNQVTP